MKGGGYGRPAMQVLSDRWRRLKGYPRREDGRLRYTVRRDDGTYRRAYGSVLVLEAFVSQRPDGHEATHRDGNCLNDAANNLRWGTSAENKADMVGHGTRPSGESHPSAKLSDADVSAVLADRAIGHTYKAIADRFGVTSTRVYQICKKGGR